ELFVVTYSYKELQLRTQLGRHKQPARLHQHARRNFIDIIRANTQSDSSTERLVDSSISVVLQDYRPPISSGKGFHFTHRGPQSPGGDIDTRFFEELHALRCAQG